MNDHIVMEYSKIDDWLYIGTNACCQMHFKQELLDKGITADLSMEGEMIDQPQGVDFYLWLPTKDHTAPTIKQLSTGVKILEEWKKLSIKVYVHCKNGHGRAPTMVAAYLINQGRSVDEAIAEIKKKRPEIHLEEVQKEQLKIFAKQLNKKI